MALRDLLPLDLAREQVKTPGQFLQRVAHG